MVNDLTVARTIHDMGLDAWFGGSLMGAVGLNRAAAAVQEPVERLRVANAGWARWTPVNLAGIAGYLVGGAILTFGNKSRIAAQQGVARDTAIKGGLTAAALGATAWSRALGKKLDSAGAVPVADGTTPSPETPREVARAQRQLKVMQWVIPAITGAILSVNARMGEQQRPAQAASGIIRRIMPGMAR
jgi:hypothetical protein